MELNNVYNIFESSMFMCTRNLDLKVFFKCNLDEGHVLFSSNFILDSNSEEETLVHYHHTLHRSLGDTSWCGAKFMP